MGKSTVAAMLFAHYKRRGIRVELAREQAKELFYQGRDLQRNQILLLARQYQILKDMEAAGTELAISDSALRLQCYYAEGQPWFHPFAALVRGLREEFSEIDILLRRAVEYQNHGRAHSEAQAKEIDAAITGHFDVELASPQPQDVIAALDPLVFGRLNAVSR